MTTHDCTETADELIKRIKADLNFDLEKKGKEKSFTPVGKRYGGGLYNYRLMVEDPYLASAAYVALRYL